MLRLREYELTGAADAGASTEAVREILSANLAAHEISLQSVARELAMSRRTLQRRLAEQQTNWRTELDAARRNESTRLKRQGASNKVIAARLGYSDTRALRRAVRRWNEASSDELSGVQWSERYDRSRSNA
jgi:AraC-like DNA-binding protein